ALPDRRRDEGPRARCDVGDPGERPSRRRRRPGRGVPDRAVRAAARGLGRADEARAGGARLTPIRCSGQVPGSGRLSQRISEGDGIAIIVRVEDAAAAREAEAQGAKAVAVKTAIDGIRQATTLPLLWIGKGAPTEVDAVRIRPEDDADQLDDLQIESVVDVRDEEELELALERFD